MQISIDSVQRSSSLKILVIGFLVLLMLIPMAMIRDVIVDRQGNALAARQDITRAWGGPQTIGGPMLIIPYQQMRVTQYGERLANDGKLFLLPETVAIDAELVTEMRYRGVHEIPVYTSRIGIGGSFAAIDTNGLGIDTAKLDWARAVVGLSVADARAIRNSPMLRFEDRQIRFEAGGALVKSMPPQIIAPLGKSFAAAHAEGTFEFQIELELGGTDRLHLLPLAETTNVSVRSTWPSPSFSGRYLPETREVSEDGFTASWRITSLGRDLPSRWIDNEQKNWNAAAAAFGVDLFVPVGVYQLSTRATKYAVLFIGLTFVGYLMFEVIAGLRLHPLQYLLVGLANAIFYLMLLSFSEHLGFSLAYLLSAIASSGLITGYSAAVLGKRSRALMMVGVLAILYGYLYMTLQAENYAMLGGSVFLWFTLALIMYLTRRVDWYSGSGEA